MKILFIYFNRYIRPRTQLSLSILETIIKQSGHETKIFDTSFYRELIDPSEITMEEAGIHKKSRGLDIPLKNTDPYEDFKKTVEEFKPDLIAFSFYSVDIDLHQKFLTPIRKDFPGVKIICGGPTASINPYSCFDMGYVDMVCFGEGENILKEVCNRIDSGQSIEDIRGLWIIKDGQIINNGLAPLTDLSTVPMQDWDSYNPIHIYGLFEGKAYRMGHAETMRGCPFNCSYCGSGSIKKAYADNGCPKYIRWKTPEQIVDECEMLKEKYNLEIFYFTVGTFTAMPITMLRKLADLYSKRVGLPFIALVHPMTINKEVAKLLKKMGCIHTSIGVESGVEEFRERVLNRRMPDERIIKAVHLLRENGIHVSTYNILGIPGMDRNHIFKTIKLNKAARPHSSLVSVLIPFPDTEITKNLLKDRIIKEEDINIGTGLYPTLDIKDMTRKEINGLFNTFNLYVKFPRILYPFIRLLEKENKITISIRKFLYKLLELERSYHLYLLRKKIRRT
jgi:radical SAM superfamily enzyme YgiQ (UPF0313 family)